MLTQRDSPKTLSAPSAWRHEVLRAPLGRPGLHRGASSCKACESASESRHRVTCERLAAPAAYSAARTASRRVNNIRPFEVTLTILRRRSSESSVRWARPSFTSRSIIWLTEGSETLMVAARLDGALSGFLSAKFRRMT